MALVAILGGAVAVHRRWMIRAFAVALSVGTIRLWIGFFQIFGLLSFEMSFGMTFWLSFPVHVLAAEIYVRKHPTAEGTSAS